MEATNTAAALARDGPLIEVHQVTIASGLGPTHVMELILAVISTAKRPLPNLKTLCLLRRRGRRPQETYSPPQAALVADPFCCKAQRHSPAL